MLVHTFLKGNSSGPTQCEAWNLLVITKRFVKMRIMILAQIHNIVLINNMLPYKQVHNFVPKSKIVMKLVFDHI